MSWLNFYLFALLSLFYFQKAHALTSADVDMGTIYGSAGTPGYYGYGWFFVLQGGTAGYVTSISVDAPPEISVDTSGCPLNVSLRTCQYEMKWCANSPGTYRTVVTATWYKIAPDNPDYPREDGIIRQSVALDIQVLGSSTNQCAGSGAGDGDSDSSSPEDKLDLSIGALNILDANEEVDGKDSINPNKDYVVQVLISGSGFKNPENRDATVTLQIGSQTRQKTVSLSGISSGGTSVPFTVNLPSDDVGEQIITATVDPLNSLGEANRQNNTSSQLLHVLCKVADTGADVPWFYQSQPPWGSQDYANQSPKKMSSLGCMVTSLAMLFKHYGIDMAADGSNMDPGAVNRGLNATPLFAELGPQYSSYNGYTPNGAVQANGAVAFARNSYFMKCIRSGGNVDSCLNESKTRVSFKHSRNDFNESSRKLINKELCNGNPVILKVPSISAPNDPTKAHFILATGMTVDEDGAPQYFVNDPSSLGGKNQKRNAGNDYIKGYRLYRPTYDPSMVFFHLSGNVDMIVTDPQGRRSGYSPKTNEVFSEIPGGTYFEAESISDPADTSIFTPAEVRFEGMEPISGQYKIQIFAKGNTSYRLTQYSFDESGTINRISDKNGSLKAGASASLQVEHSELAIPVQSAALNISKATFVDTHYKDMAFVSGSIATANGRSIYSIDKYLQIKIGSFTKAIDKRFLKKIKAGRQTNYIYGSFGKNGLFISLNADTGEFKLFVGNIQIDNGDTKITTDLMIQADDVIAKGLVTFKNTRKNKKHGK